MDSLTEEEENRLYANVTAYQAYLGLEAAVWFLRSKGLMRKTYLPLFKGALSTLKFQAIKEDPR